MLSRTPRTGRHAALPRGGRTPRRQFRARAISSELQLGAIAVTASAGRAEDGRPKLPRIFLAKPSAKAMTTIAVTALAVTALAVTAFAVTAIVVTAIDRTCGHRTCGHCNCASRGSLRPSAPRRRRPHACRTGPSGCGWLDGERGGAREGARERGSERGSEGGEREWRDVQAFELGGSRRMGLPLRPRDTGAQPRIATAQAHVCRRSSGWRGFGPGHALPVRARPRSARHRRRGFVSPAWLPGGRRCAAQSPGRASRRRPARAGRRRANPSRTCRPSPRWA